jgi:hypothetical protein
LNFRTNENVGDGSPFSFFFKASAPSAVTALRMSVKSGIMTGSFANFLAGLDFFPIDEVTRSCIDFLGESEGKHLNLLKSLAILPVALDASLHPTRPIVLAWLPVSIVVAISFSFC